MKNTEIIVKNPGPQGGNSDYSIRNESTVHILIDGLQHGKINGKTSPKLIDLFTGEGGVVNAFKKRGWSRENIVRIDHGLPTTTPEEKFLTWDLEVLAHELREKRDVPTEVREYEHSFDLLVVFAACNERTISWFGEEVLSPLGLFFLRQGGVAYLDMNTLTPEEMKNGWKLVHPRRTDLYRRK